MVWATFIECSNTQKGDRMAKKYTAEQKEYARQRRNYLARVRYQLNKKDYTEEEKATIKSQMNVPTASEVSGDLSAVESYEALFEDTNYDALFEAALAIETKTVSIEKPTEKVGKSKKEVFKDWYEYVADENRYVSKLTGESYLTADEALADLEGYDIENAIREGNEIFATIRSILEDREALHQRKFDESGHSTSMVIRPEQILDELMLAISENKDALALQLAQSDENIIALVQDSLYYGEKSDEPMSRLFSILKIDPKYENLVNEYYQAADSDTTGSLYSSDDEDWFDI